MGDVRRTGCASWQLLPFGCIGYINGSGPSKEHLQENYYKKNP